MVPACKQRLLARKRLKGLRNSEGWVLDGLCFAVFVSVSELMLRTSRDDSVDFADAFLTLASKAVRMHTII